MGDNKQNRILYFDSLRGIASLCVVLHHFICIFWCALYYEEEAHTVFESVWNKTPLNALTNGNLPVQFFFVLSGLLITKKVYERTPSGLNAIWSKFFNLLKLVIPAILFPFVLMRCNLMYHLRAAETDPSLSFAVHHNNFSPTLLSVPADIINTFASASKYNSPLWTIHFEFLGSLLIMLVAFYIKRTINHYWSRKLAYGIIYFALGLINLNFCAFVAGGLTYEVYYSTFSEVNTDPEKRTIKPPFLIKISLFILGIYFSTINMHATGIWAPFHFLASFSSQIRVFGLSLSLLMLMISPKVQLALSFTPLVKLGNLSRFIYIFHWPIMLSLGCYSYLRFSAVFDRGMVLFLAAVISVMGTILLSAVYLICRKAVIIVIEKKRSR